MTDDTDAVNLDHDIGADVAQAAREAQEAASDAKLDATVREAAVKAYSKREDQPLPTPHGRTMDQTIADTMRRIQAAEARRIAEGRP